MVITGWPVISCNTTETLSCLVLHLDFGAETVTLSDLQGVADEKETDRFLEAVQDKRKGRDIDK